MKRSKSYKLAFIILVFLPIFIGYEASRGIITDANPFNTISSPVLPLSTILVIFSLIFGINKKNAVYFLGLNVLFGILSVVIFFYLGLFRQFAYNIAILLGSAAYYSGMVFNRKYPYQQLTQDVTLALVLIILTKLGFDLIGFSTIYSDNFISEEFKIYNAYDYFPLVYLLGGAMGILAYRYNRLLGMVAILVSFTALFSFSRYYAASVGLLYLLSSLRIYRIRTTQLITFSFLCVIVITGLLAGFASSFHFDPSLYLRFEHWYSFFSAVTVLDLLVPVLNDYRSVLSWGGLHNELLELYSYFGVFTIILVVIFTRLTSNLRSDSKVSLVPLMVILLIGMLVQNNLTQPYNVTAVFFIIGLFQMNTDRPVHIRS